MNYVDIPTMETPRLILRKLRRSDTEHYFHRLVSDEAVTRYMLFDPHRDISQSEASIEKALNRYAQGRCYRWAVALKEDDSLIGVFELLRFQDVDSSCSFAYMLSRDHWNRGYGTEVMKAAFRFAFEVLGVQKIEADHMADNPASGAVMRKAGMRYVGTIHQKYEKHGVFHDACCYEIRKEDFHDC